MGRNAQNRRVVKHYFKGATDATLRKRRERVIAAAVSLLKWKDGAVKVAGQYHIGVDFTDGEVCAVWMRNRAGVIAAIGTDRVALDRCKRLAWEVA